MNLFTRAWQAILGVFAATEERPQSREEELANSLSHGLGLAAVLAAAALLLATAAQRGSPSFIVGASVYAATLVALYLASTLYHALPVGQAKSAWLICDHSAVFLLIAGTYTPFAFGVLRGAWGAALFIVVWGLALAGIAFKVIGGPVRYPKLSTGMYLGMGWVLLLAAGPVLHLMPLAGLQWLLAGGGRVYRRRGVFPSRTDTLRALHMAPVCPRRHGLSLHRGVALRGWSMKLKSPLTWSLFSKEEAMAAVATRKVVNHARESVPDSALVQRLLSDPRAAWIWVRIIPCGAGSARPGAQSPSRMKIRR